ncbi:MAG: rhodanese-like domain-containing protein, partial [Pseudomonadota bacterium]|nr:rhodanese-like domain-containing protein [Pseudomonadota bacterium]
MTTDWLAGRLERVKVIDASWHLPAAGRNARAEFEAAHIPGAVFFDLDAIADTSSDLPHMLPSPEAFGEAIGRLGVGDADCVVVYDSVGLFSAARVWWTFRAMGHDAVRVLEGGLPRWRAEGRPLESGARSAPTARFRAALRPELVRSLDQVRAGLATERLVDARPGPRFRGEA